MKKIVTAYLFTPFYLLISIIGFSQTVIHVQPGANIFLSTGSIFTLDSMILQPVSDFTLTDVTIKRNDNIINPSYSTAIKRSYSFSNTTSPFSGTVQMFYRDDELNGLPEAILQLNIFNGTGWLAIGSNTNNTTSNFVLSNSFTNRPLRELTLASSLNPLPVTLLSFTGKKQNNSSLLEWVTSQEINTRNFNLQHNTSGAWRDIATVPAAGNSTVNKYYHFLHTNPLNGINNYRLQQRDMDGSIRYSAIVAVYFSGIHSLIVAGNPVTDNQLKLISSEQTFISFFDSKGGLLFRQNIPEGISIIDMSRFATGLYLLQSKNGKFKIILSR